MNQQYLDVPKATGAAKPAHPLHDRVAVVTGGSRGLGEELARQLLDAGCRVAICGRQSSSLQEAVSRLAPPTGRLLAVQADVGREDDVLRLFAQTLEAFGRIDILINNAGNFDGGPVEDITLEQWNHVLGACLTGPFLCTREAFRCMKAQGGGRILNIGSISAQRARPHSAPYTSAKFGLQGLTHAAALDGRAYGIIVSCLHPGNIGVAWRTKTADGRESEPMMSAPTVARAALSMLALPNDVNFLEGILLPSEQLYLGRG